MYFNSHNQQLFFEELGFTLSLKTQLYEVDINMII